MSAVPRPRRLRILHTENSLAWGGQEVRILTEAKGMLERGHTVKLLACPDAPIGAEARRIGLPVEWLRIDRKQLRPLLHLRDWIARHAHGFDVINTHSSTDSWLTALARTSLPRALRVPPIVRTRHVSTTVNRHRSTRWLYLDATSHIVTTGEALRRQLAEDNGFPLERMTSVRTGIDLERYVPMQRRMARQSLGVADRPTLGIVATLRSWKGHDDLLHAFASLRARFPDWQLLVVGDGPQRARLEALVGALGLAADVRFVGNVTNVPEWLATLDVYVLPSYGDEGVPQGIMQAMACARPVVSTPVGAIREAVQADVTGMLVRPRDPASLAHGLATLMADASLRETMGAAGLAYARSHFGIEVMLDRMEAVFHGARLVQ